jgi:AraC-like DNA-binding protein/mannose-6-phosphate isomerase-like protein (cupin superfamily)
MLGLSACLSLKCQIMSKKRQQGGSVLRKAEDGIVVRTFAVRHTNGHVIGRHVHDWHQLIYASEGVMWVQTVQGDWVVPPNRAVWVPAGVEHSIEMTGSVFVQTLYLDRTLSSALPPQCCAVNVAPLLRELIRHTVTLGVLDKNDSSQARLIGVLVDQFGALPTIPLQLPWPLDERAQRAATWLRAHPDDPGIIKQVARRVAVSVRTLERLFQKETGLTFGKWRQQLRLLHALRLLASGRPVTAVALEVGYESASAFIAMFKRTLGVTPYRYFSSGGSGVSNPKVPSRLPF